MNNYDLINKLHEICRQWLGNDNNQQIKKIGDELIRLQNKLDLIAQTTNYLTKQHIISIFRISSKQIEGLRLKYPGFLTKKGRYIKDNWFLLYSFSYYYQFLLYTFGYTNKVSVCFPRLPRYGDSLLKMMNQDNILNFGFPKKVMFLFNLASTPWQRRRNLIFNEESYL